MDTSDEQARRGRSRVADRIPIEIEPEETEEEDAPDVPMEPLEPLDDPEEEPALS